MTQSHPKPAQPSPENHQKPDDLTKWQWAICNLVALKSGSGSDFTSFEDWVDDLNTQGPAALCSLSRDHLFIHQGIRVQGLPSADIDNQVKRLQDEVNTHTGKSFGKASNGARLDHLLEPIDFICWLAQVGKFRTDWSQLKPEFYPLYMAILFGLVLARLGKVIEAGTPITDVIPDIVEQYQRGEGLLPDPNTKSIFLRKPPPPGPSFLRQAIPRPPIPQHSQFCTGELSAWATVIVVLLLLLLMSTLVAPQLAPPRGARSFWW